MKEKNNKYKDHLRNAFPKTLQSDVEVVLGVLPFENKNVKWIDQQIIKIDNFISPTVLTVHLDNEVLSIPYRIYLNETDIDKEGKLTDIQKTILDCIYLRHFDGFLRQRRAENLIGKNYYWVIPFTIQLLGEYVFEILQVLDAHINDKTMGNYVKFIRENPKYWHQTECRMISYWNVYYRQQYYTLKSYLGYELVEKIKNSERFTAQKQ